MHTFRTNVTLIFVFNWIQSIIFIKSNFIFSFLQVVLTFLLFVIKSLYILSDLMVYFLGHSSNKLPFLLWEFIKITYVSLHILIFFAFLHFKMPLSVCHPSFKYAIIYLHFFFRCKSQFRRLPSLDLIEKCPFLPLYKSIIAFVVLLLKIHKCFKWVRLPFQPCNVCYKFL